MNKMFSRREFLRRGVLAAVAAGTAPAFIPALRAVPPSGTLLHASIGASGMAASDLQQIARHPFVKVVAIADVEIAKAEQWKERFPEARFYQDWRQLLAKEKALDTLNVSTPDHMHAPIAMSAMQLSKSVYVQKPLAHDIYETRKLTEFARARKLVTQMGIQIHSLEEYQLAVRLVRDGVIGKIKAVHTWSNKDWGDPKPKPDRQDPVPPGLDWDGWLGVAAARPFIGEGYYHPGNWRRSLDFGTGTFGDMGCHIYDPVFNALALTAPLTVRSEGAAPNPWHWASNAVIHYTFPGTPYTDGDTVKVTWYDGNQKPPPEVGALLGEVKRPGQGSVFIGTKGIMLLPHVGKPRLLPEAQFADFKMPTVANGNHYTLFLEGVRDNGKPTANFDYSGPLTETVLLGGVASRFPQTTLAWNSARLRFTNLSAADKFLRRKYRRGWEVKGLS
ncbi:MAG TPA: Gfo/Idh/MocA family oxidoreductase [Verrucomicrobiota bacterium]|jgi:predicted dehydrogenase|nr:MAG: Glucose--fructose oxidoreductase precursor [Verrucomicrobia bacterium ADurb.Bin118]HPY29162.1 Gfo/Idh/MocA family oxidoreductase [Verrucomicrobiota bacterium]HQB17300.1 Gfo/Idh/MocA family oxidoreductase [Verrucomicrobiota bacterium]